MLLFNVSQGRGKRFRPALAFLIARMLGEIDEKALVEAPPMVELIHTARLIHDDMVDESEKTRLFICQHGLVQSDSCFGWRLSLCTSIEQDDTSI